MLNYRHPDSSIPYVVHAMWGNPFGFKQSVDREQLLDEMNKKNSGKGPRRDPGFSFGSICVIIFIIICCFAGLAIGDKLDGARGALFGLVAGLIVGRILGPRLVEYLGNLRTRGWRRSPKKENEDKDGENTQGPFIR